METSKTPNNSPLPPVAPPVPPASPTSSSVHSPSISGVGQTGNPSTTKSKLMISGILFLIIALSIAGYLYGSRKTIHITNPPTDEGACIQAGGTWVSVDSPEGIYRCNLPTRDSGKECRDNDECISFLCIASEDRNGTCYGFTEHPSCYTSIIKGEIQPETCFDTAPGSTPGSTPGSDPSSENLPRTPGENGDNIPIPMPVPNEACGIQQCHGMDFTCGPVPSTIMCTFEYQMGDKCREFATCEVVNGVCQHTPSTKFTQCVSCVDECKKIVDPVASFQCEREC